MFDAAARFSGRDASTVAFAVATASLQPASDGDEGLLLLNEAHRMHGAFGRRHAALAVALFHVAMSQRHAETGEEDLKNAYLDEARVVLGDELARMPDNALAQTTYASV